MRRLARSLLGALNKRRPGAWAELKHQLWLFAEYDHVMFGKRR